MLTPEEVQALELEKAYAKKKCGELQGTIQELQRILNSYTNNHARWSAKYQRADRKLAENDNRYQLLPSPKERKRKKKTGNNTVDIILRMKSGEVKRLVKQLEKEVRK